MTLGPNYCWHVTTKFIIKGQLSLYRIVKYFETRVKYEVMKYDRICNVTILYASTQ